MKKLQNTPTISIDDLIDKVQDFVKVNPENPVVQSAIAQAQKEFPNTKIQNNDRDRKNQLQS